MSGSTHIIRAFSHIRDEVNDETILLSFQNTEGFPETEIAQDVEAEVVTERGHVLAFCPFAFWGSGAQQATPFLDLLKDMRFGVPNRTL